MVLFIVCNTFKPFMTTKLSPFVTTTYHLQQCYLLSIPQISCPPLCCCLPMVSTILWYKVFPIPYTTTKSENIYNKKKINIYEHNKTLCNTNMNYYFLFFHTLDNQTPTKNYENPLTIFHYIKTNTTFSHVLFLFFQTKVSLTSIFLMI